MRGFTIIALAFAAASGVALAQTTLYKLIDRNGKVTYSEEKPKSFDGQVIPLDIDPSRNTTTMPKYTPPAPAAGASGPRPPQSGGGVAVSREAVAAARERVDAARKALADARENPGETDLQHLGTKGGGTRPVPTAEYTKRLAKLEEDVHKAEEQLSRLESASR
jgi:hypothetical protein